MSTNILQKMTGWQKGVRWDGWQPPEYLPFWLNTSTNLSVTSLLGKFCAGTALIIGYDFLRPVDDSGD